MHYLLNSFLQHARTRVRKGRDFDIAHHYADGDLSRLPDLAIDLAQLEPAVFVTGNVVATPAIKQATTSIPIVNPSLSDPVGRLGGECGATRRTSDRHIGYIGQPDRETAGIPTQISNSRF
jgi:hypothetical protein